MPVRELIVTSVLLLIVFGGIGWTKLAYWEWLRDRDDQTS